MILWTAEISHNFRFQDTEFISSFFFNIHAYFNVLTYFHAKKTLRHKIKIWCITYAPP